MSINDKDNASHNDAMNKLEQWKNLAFVVNFALFFAAFMALKVFVGQNAADMACIVLVAFLLYDRENSYVKGHVDTLIACTKMLDELEDDLEEISRKYDEACADEKRTGDEGKETKEDVITMQDGIEKQKD